MSESRSAVRSRIRRRRLIHLLTGALLGAALLALSAVSGLAADKSIETAGSIGSYHWEPSSATVGAGGTVEFKNMAGHGTHALVWEGAPETPSCPGVPTEGSTSWSGTCTFNTAGTYNFHCPVHPTEMRGTITVSGPTTPVATTGTASPVSDESETLNGTVNPNGLATSYYFEYGTSTAYGTKTTEESVGSGTGNVSKAVAVSGLSANTTYHFRIVATYETNKTAVGADHTFTTTGEPAATTSPATAVGGRKATFAGSVNPRGHATTYYFKYGTTEAYGQQTAPESAGSGTASVSVPVPVTGLAPEQTYHFELVAENSSGGPVLGGDQQFTTFGKPVVTTGQATGITNIGATLGGAINAEGQETTYRFKFGTTEAYGQETTSKSAGSGTNSMSLSAPVAGLAPETTYHFRLVAENESGAAEGQDHTFTTEAAPPPPPPPPPTPTPTPAPPASSPPLASPPPAAILAPDTTITLKPPSKTHDRTPTVRFAATAGGATFQCSVDNGPFRACRSPFTAPSLKPGRHRIRVKAVAAGLADPTPASCSFKVVAAKRRR